MTELKRVFYHVTHTSCYTYFAVTGHFPTESVSAMLRLTPDRSHNIGDLRKNGTRYDAAVWEFGTCREYDVIVGNQMLRTVAPLTDKTDILKAIKQQYRVQYLLIIVPTVRYDEPAPCLDIPKEVMRFCCETDTEITIDLYVSCPDDCTHRAILENN